MGYNDYSDAINIRGYGDLLKPEDQANNSNSFSKEELDRLENEIIEKSDDFYSGKSNEKVTEDYVQKFRDDIAHIMDGSPAYNNAAEKEMYSAPDNRKQVEKQPIGGHMQDNYFSPQTDNMANLYSNEFRDPQLTEMVDEEEKQKDIRNILNDDEEDENQAIFDMEKEEEEDNKLYMINDICELRQLLEDDGVDTSNIPNVNKDSSFQDVNDVYKILRLKNDKNRFRCMGEEAILLIARALEYAFDGEREWFGRKPDLVGWEDTVKVKLRRMRHDTALLVQDIVKTNKISPLTRILLELLPSAFLFGRTKAKSKYDAAYQKELEDKRYREALSQLNSME
jgi:hypothetical protein